MRRLVIIGLMMGLLLGSGVLQATALPPMYRVNAPYFGGSLRFDEAAVFWLGRITPDDTYADVRVGYIDRALWLHINRIDRRLWYDPSPDASTLTAWDSVTIYLDKRGNTAGAPTADSYRFDAQLNWWEPRVNWQAAYRGDGTGWTSIPITFTTYGTWYNPTGAPNTNTNAHGWFVAFSIPFQNLGVPSPPAPGTIWALSVVVHDRDSSTGPMNPDTVWPPTMLPNLPASWGQLHFGLPTYTPSLSVIPEGTTIVRHGLNGAVVQDGVVGGNTLCGGSLTDYFQQWGDLNYAHDTVLNVQNVEHVSEWPCFSKMYVTFPLTAMPSGKTVISATLTLHHRGNPGPEPEPAYIQALTVNQDWNEDTLTWNNAPSARENLGGSWIPSVSSAPAEPGIPYQWEVSRAVAEAYSSGEPLRLAIYAASGPFHNGRYFHSSDAGSNNAIARPRLAVAWGSAAPAVQISARPLQVHNGGRVTFTVSLLGNGQGMTLTDSLPPQLSAPGVIQVVGSGAAHYEAGSHLIKWAGKPQAEQPVTIIFPVTVLTALPFAISNRVVVTDTVLGESESTVVLIANGYAIWLPLVRR